MINPRSKMTYSEEFYYFAEDYPYPAYDLSDLAQLYKDDSEFNFYQFTTLVALRLNYPDPDDFCRHYSAYFNLRQNTFKVCNWSWKWICEDLYLRSIYGGLEFKDLALMLDRGDINE